MRGLQDISVPIDMSIIDAIETIDRSALQILLVVDKDNRLLGTVTDGDIRRGILQGVSLESPVAKAMNSDPISVGENTPRDEVLSLMRNKLIHCIPIIGESGRIVGLEAESHLLWQGTNETSIVLMAGGLGMRMRPLTNTLPKPLLEINGKPLLEHIIARFAEQGFRKFFISVNYKSKMIKDYFGSGEKYGVDIHYLEEKEPLGTGGALSMLPREKITSDIIVMNADLLTKLNFRQLISYHQKEGGVATMCVRDYSFRVPYGVVNVEEENFVDIVEKPAHSYFVNTGIYVIKANELKNIPKNSYFDLPELFSILKKQQKKVTVFPLREDWTDIGSQSDYDRVKN